MISSEDKSSILIVNKCGIDQSNFKIDNDVKFEGILYCYLFIFVRDYLITLNFLLFFCIYLLFRLYFFVVVFENIEATIKVKAHLMDARLIRDRMKLILVEHHLEIMLHYKPNLFV